jgi:hypothetical protein
MAVYFDIPRNYSGGAKSAKEVKMRSRGYEKQRVTVKCINADGKLPPYVIRSCKTTPKNKMFSKNVIVHAQIWLDDS